MRIEQRQGRALEAVLSHAAGWNKKQIFNVRLQPVLEGKISVREDGQPVFEISKGSVNIHILGVEFLR